MEHETTAILKNELRDLLARLQSHQSSQRTIQEVTEWLQEGERRTNFVTDDQRGVDVDPPSSSSGPNGECSARPSRSRACKKPQTCQVEGSSSSDDDDAYDDDLADELWNPTRTSRDDSDSDADLEDEPGEDAPRCITPSNFALDGVEETEQIAEPQVPSNKALDGVEETEQMAEPVPLNKGGQETQGRVAAAVRSSAIHEGEWKRGGWRPRDIPFTATPGPRGAGRLTSDQPADFAKLMISDELLHTIAEQTNLYAEQSMTAAAGRGTGAKSHSWKTVTVQELRNFFGLFFLTGIVKKQSLASYWSTDELLSTPYFGKTMARNRFQLIWRYLHFSDNRANDGSDKLHKIRPVLDHVLSKFGELYQPNSKICIDEGMMAWRGRLRFSVYNPQKPIKYGIKSYIVCDSETGYCFGMKPYCGDAGYLGNTVVSLLDRLAGHGYKLYMDNYYNSVALADRLLQLNTHVCGTLRKNRGGPKTVTHVSNSNLGPGKTIARHNGNVMVLAWRDKKVETMITSFHQDEMHTSTGRPRGGSNERVPVQKPACAVDYHNSMSGVDRLDQNIADYLCVRKSAKWTKKFVLYLFQICLFNSFILYKAMNPQGKHRKLLSFITSVARSFTGGKVEVEAGIEDAWGSAGEVDFGLLLPGREPRTPKTDPPTRLDGRIANHVMMKYKPTAKKRNPARACRVCKLRGFRRETSFYCASCQAPLHLKDCFRIYHTEHTLHIYTVPK